MHSLFDDIGWRFTEKIVWWTNRLFSNRKYWNQYFLFNRFLLTLPIQNSIKSLFVICVRRLSHVFSTFFTIHTIKHKKWYMGQFNKLRWKWLLLVCKLICYGIVCVLTKYWICFLAILFDSKKVRVFHKYLLGFEKSFF